MKSSLSTCGGFAGFTITHPSGLSPLRTAVPELSRVCGDGRPAGVAVHGRFPCPEDCGDHAPTAAATSRRGAAGFRSVTSNPTGAAPSDRFTLRPAPPQSSAPRRPPAASPRPAQGPRRLPARGRGRESEQVALERGRLDAVIAGLLFMGGMRRSEVSGLRWADVDDAADGDGVLVTVRREKANQEGETRDVRFVKDAVARTIRTLRARRARRRTIASCRSRRRWWGCGSRRRHEPPASST